MKKFIITFSITFTVLLISLVGVIITKNYNGQINEISSIKEERDTALVKKNELEKKYSEVQDLLTVITPEKFKSEVATGKKMYVYIGRPDCGDCSVLEQKLVDYIKNHKQVQDNLVFVNVRLLHQDEIKWKEFKLDYQLSGTPHFALWEHGKQVSMTESNEDVFTLDMFDAWAKKSNLIN